jgi:hypothetical protein
MKLLEIKNRKSNAPEIHKAREVINTDKIETIMVTGKEIIIEFAEGSVREEYDTIQEANSRYSEIIALLSDQVAPAHPMVGNEILRQYSVVLTADEVCVNDGTRNISYPYSPLNCLINARQSYQMAMDDIWTEAFNMYSDMGYPVGPNEATPVHLAENDLGRVTELIKKCLEISKSPNPVDVFIRYSGHTDELDVDIHVNGWKSGNSPDFQFTTSSLNSWEPETFRLRSLDELEAVLNLLVDYNIPDLSTKYIQDLRSYILQMR